MITMKVLHPFKNPKDWKLKNLIQYEVNYPIAKAVRASCLIDT